MPRYSQHKLGIIGLICMAIVASFAIAQADIEPSGGNPWDLRGLPQEGAFVFYDTPEGASLTGKPVDVADINGDGCGDLAITGQNASFPKPDGYRVQGGQVRILLDLCDIDGRIALEEGMPANHQIVTFLGERAGDMAGTEIAVGDLNGDGYSDVAFGAQNSDSLNRSRPNAGAVYVVFGSPDFAATYGAEVDLQTPPEGVVVFYGATEEDRFGIWVETGDFDADGYDDLIIGATQADGEGDRRINAGEAWILYGAPDWTIKYGQVTDMRTPPIDATRIIGADFDDLLGSCVWGRGDLNGDGYTDAIVSAALWRGSAGVEGLSFGGGDGPGNARYNAGDTYVIFGGPQLRGQTVDLAARIDPNTGAPRDTSITVIYGPDPNDLLGEEIATGDLNGDGQDDLVLGTLIGSGPNNQYEGGGEAWVIYTDENFAGRMIDLSNPLNDAVVVYVDQADSKGGDTLRVADFDGDGFNDLAYGAPNYDAVGYDLIPRRNAGLLAILYGQAGGFPHDGRSITLPSEQPNDLRVRYVVGADENDMMAYAIAVYDINGDGYIDIIPNAMGGDGANNTSANAGEIYVLNGALLSGIEVAITATPEATEAPQPPAPTATTASQLPPVATLPPLPDATLPPLFDTSQAGDPQRGETLYNEGCAGCHGPEGDGSGVGLPLAGSDFVNGLTDEELLDFLRVGRSSDSPNSVTGMGMPAYGGRIDWGDGEMWDIIAYIRQLNAPNSEE